MSRAPDDWPGERDARHRDEGDAPTAFLPKVDRPGSTPARPAAPGAWPEPTLPPRSPQPRPSRGPEPAAGAGRTPDGPLTGRQRAFPDAARATPEPGRPANPGWFAPPAEQPRSTTNPTRPTGPGRPGPPAGTGTGAPPPWPGTGPVRPA
ncbi:hypothetical protein V6V16_05995, partial [Micromonospora sp. CPCC 205561]